MLAGYHSIPGPTLRRHDWEYGNGIFSRLPARMHRLVDLSVPHREPRNAIDASFDWHGARVRTVVAHLGVARAGTALALLPGLGMLVGVIGRLEQAWCDPRPASVGLGLVSLVLAGWIVGRIRRWARRGGPGSIG